MSNDNDKPFMQRVYDSEIDASIEWLWDGGFSMKLGDPDVPEVRGNVSTLREVEAWFREQILKYYPDSEFSKAERTAEGV
jgi:hypothetical protein